MRKTRSIRIQFMLSFTAIAVLIIGTISLMTYNLVDRHFDRYVVERQKDVLTELTQLLEAKFSISEAQWSAIDLEQVGDVAKSEAIDLTVYDEAGQVIWRSSQEKNGHMGNGMMNNHSKMMDSNMQSKNGSYVEETISLKSAGSKIGKVVFGYFGPLSYTNHDVAFITDLRKSLLWIAVGALLGSLLFAVWLAQKLSSPISQLTLFTQKIAKGHYHEKQQPISTITEIRELIDAVQDLSVQLDKQQALRNQLSSDISHEIRTPLTTLKGHIEAMLDGIWEPTKERLESCYEEVNRLNRLIGDIDKITELEEQQEKLQKNTFDVFQLAKRICLNIEPLMKQKEIDFTLTGRNLEVFADQDKISQVMTNLLTNALKFTGNRGEIDLAIHKEADDFCISVKDNGIGISSEDRAFIFQRFYMVDSSRNSEGQGIGLAIVKSIVKAHNGRIEVDSIVGEGTKFKLYFPLS
ncbi:sensor histidine kinase [Carnobacterium gallinarum]|uniref:sensor histidine kinase n=1 Tax=Carnobacterium gallinarum TaxID=2749 RepID=UPI00055993BB|nr:HAMP domain-containing sensor histidine kinase [Carnobacterium gallinarum]